MQAPRRSPNLWSFALPSPSRSPRTLRPERYATHGHVRVNNSVTYSLSAATNSLLHGDRFLRQHRDLLLQCLCLSSESLFVNNLIPPPVPSFRPRLVTWSL